MVLSVAESVFIIEKTKILNGVGQKASAFFLNVFLCLLAFHNTSKAFISRFENKGLYKFVCLIGRYSFGIYLIHLFILQVVSKVMNFALPPLALWMAMSVIVTVITLGGLVFCKRICRKISWILLGV